MEVREAIERLRAGGLVIIPTETVYGIAASLDHPEAIAQIYELKKRPRTNPLLVHVATRKQVAPLVKALPPGTDALMETYWPGPLSLVLPVNEMAVPAIARADGKTVGIRMPDHPLALEIIRETGPLVATSVNISGEKPAASEGEICFDVPVVVSDEPLSGEPSTVISYIDGEWTILRSGSLGRESFPHRQKA